MAPWPQPLKNAAMDRLYNTSTNHYTSIRLDDADEAILQPRSWEQASSGSSAGRIRANHGSTPPTTPPSLHAFAGVITKVLLEPFVRLRSVFKKEFDFTTFHNVINGDLKTTETTRHAINPHTKKPLGEVPLSTAKDVDDAIAAARAAFPKWKKTSFEERAKGLNGLAATIYEYQQGFVKLNGYELGAPVSIAEILVHMGTGWLSETAKLHPKDEVVEDTPEREVIVRYLPLGVAVGIVPWNLPLYCTAAKIAAAIIAGNCIIIKPSPYPPYSGLKLVEMALLESSNWLHRHRKEGHGVGLQAPKRVTLELGGNNAAIITKNIDVATIAPALAGVIFSHSSQAFKLGEGVGEGENDPTVNIGPVQNEIQYERVKGFFNDIEKEGWKVAVGGKIDESPGPILPILSWSDEDDVIARANNSRMGLGGSVWSIG
ncbi:hypothetical protein VC83_06737 [Pseudogymnoascus destructans]|uniref:aldehyde dehydrogenase (NAD(+)) n=1 Tax=Pseudogymnoascus destructans TaxID=655981 RepID=A0A177A4S5_9PEZI|nr:uncharacterized protein VC83_06737 [Pseudogymnoascus destructans]OAF56241.1 hypothetical protein VC83_06737 [Pseudogymnoascus destructans]